MPWIRPKSVPTGQVWSRFQGKAINGEPAKMYQMRDLEERYRKQCLDMTQVIFLRDEPLCAVLGIPQDPSSISTIRANWEKYLDQGVSLACFTEKEGQPDQLVAVSIIVVRTIDEEEEDVNKVEGEAWKKLLKTLVAVEKLVDVFSLYGLDIYMSTNVLTVVPECRGQNIGARMLEASNQLCKALGIRAISTVFTAITSQVLAAKSGYEVLAELPYSKMLEEGVDLNGCVSPSAKVMGIKFNFE